MKKTDKKGDSPALPIAATTKEKLSTLDLLEEIVTYLETIPAIAVRKSIVEEAGGAYERTLDNLESSSDANVSAWAESEIPEMEFMLPVASYRVQYNIYQACGRLVSEMAGELISEREEWRAMLIREEVAEEDVDKLWERIHALNQDYLMGYWS